MASGERYSFIRVLRANHGWGYDLLAAMAVLAVKLYGGRADSGALRWILAPTARWVGILSGREFVYEPQIGYVNHRIRFIIAPSCSGIQFMAILFVVLTVLYVHRMRKHLGRVLWMAGSAAASVILTVFVNGFRIALSIWLPELVFGRGSPVGWLTPGRLHTLTGVAVYFTALLVICPVGDLTVRRIVRAASGEEVDEGSIMEGDRRHTGWGPAAGIYLVVVLALPLLNGAYADHPGQFLEYAALVAAVCITILCLSCVTAYFREVLRRRPRKQARK